MTAGTDPPEQPCPEVVVGVVAAPGAAGDLARSLQEPLRAALQDRLRQVRWRLQLVEDPLVEPPADSTEIVSAARALLLAREWDLGVCLTDLPLQVNRRPVVAHASPLHAVALLSVPALGAVAVHRRAMQAALRLVDELLGAPDLPADGGEAAQDGGKPSRQLGRRLHELGTDTDVDTDAVRFTARVLTGNVRLLIGMVRANRPWRLAVGLSRALAAAAATGVFALVTSDIWRLADAFGLPRLLAVALGSVVTITATLIVGAGLWEQVQHRRAREQVVLFNIATTATVLIGVLALYAALFVLSLLAALLLVVPGLFASALTHPVTVGDYAELAWLASSLATLGGALGAGLETDESVRQAAYTHRTSAIADQQPP